MSAAQNWVAEAVIGCQQSLAVGLPVGLAIDGQTHGQMQIGS